MGPLVGNSKDSKAHIWIVKSFIIGSIGAINAPIITEKYQTVIETITVDDVDNEVIVDCTPTFMCITFANENAFFKRDQIGIASSTHFCWGK